MSRRHVQVRQDLWACALLVYEYHEYSDNYAQLEVCHRVVPVCSTSTGLPQLLVVNSWGKPGDQCLTDVLVYGVFVVRMSRLFSRVMPYRVKKCFLI